MLRSIKDLEGCTISATGGNLGRVTDLYCDDEAWAIRYLVVDTGSWLVNRKVLISPLAIGEAHWSGKLLHVLLTREQVKGSPDIDTGKPITRAGERDYLDYCGFPYYWDSGDLGSCDAYQYPMFPRQVGYCAAFAECAEEKRAHAPAEAGHRDVDSHLRSCNAMIGYQIQGADGQIGHVSGMLVDLESWAVRYLIVKTGKWWRDHELLVAPQWIQDVNGLASKIWVDLTRDALKEAHRYDPSVPLGGEMGSLVGRHQARIGHRTDDTNRGRSPPGP